jgi:hypothetical protein
LSQSGGHDAPWLASEFVPGLAAVVDDIVVAEEDAVGEPVVAQKLPDVFGRVEFGTFGREGDEREIAGDVELAGRMPTRLIEKQDGVARPEATSLAISSRCSCIASVLHLGRIRPTALPSFGQMAPKI